jgi:hypothetical protein
VRHCDELEEKHEPISIAFSEPLAEMILKTGGVKSRPLLSNGRSIARPSPDANFLGSLSLFFFLREYLTHPTSVNDISDDDGITS